MPFTNPVNATQSGFQSITTGGAWNGRTFVAGNGTAVVNGDGIAGAPSYAMKSPFVGNFEFDGDTLSLTSSQVGINLGIGAVNTDTSNTSSSAVVASGVISGTSGDPFFQLDIQGVNTNKFGLDNSASDIFVYNVGCNAGTSGLDGTTILQMTQAGQVTKPLQPAFGYYNGSTRSNVTGDGTSYTLIFDTASWTQQGSGFDGTSTFTAPVTGVYHFDLAVRLNGVVAQTSAYTTFTFTTRTYYGQYVSGVGVVGAGALLSLVQSVTHKMTAGDTLTCTVVVGGSTKTVSIDGSAADTYLSGYLAC